MDAVYRLRTFGANFTMHARDGGVEADGEQGLPSHEVELRGDAAVVPGLGGQVVRFSGGDATVTGVADFTGGRTFTVIALFRATPTGAYQRVAGRVNGGTEVSLGIDREGRLQATVGSARGGYRETLTGTSVVADGQWHAVALMGLPRIFNGLALTLMVDDREERTGSISPGLFGTSPDYTMTTPVVVGRTADTTAPLQGEVAAVAGADRAWTMESTTALLAQDMRGASGAGFVGWGVPVV